MVDSINNDKIREHVLNFLYDINKKARFPKGAEVGIKKIQSELKERYKYKQQEVSSNLNYLLDKDWVIEITDTKEVKTKTGMTVPSTTKKYRITAKGIEHIEGASKFGSQNLTSGINIKNVSGVVIVGNSNIVVNEKYRDLFDSLEILHRNVLDNSDINDTKKLDLGSDINSLKNQLSKTKPHTQIIHKLWNTIKTSVTTHGFAEMLTDISEKIINYFPSH